MTGEARDRSQLLRGARRVSPPWAAFVLASLVTSGLRGETITVDTTVDDLTVNANCTLREAIEAANTNAAVDACPAGEASPTVDRIEIPAGVFDLTLQVGPGVEDANQEGDLDISEEVDIFGAGMDLTSIDGMATERIFDLQVSDLTRLSTLHDLEVRNGYADNAVGGGTGGGIRLLGNLYMYFCRITGNASYASTGGGIYHGTTGSVLVIYDSEISSNQATGSAAASGGISALALLELHRSTVSGNSTSGSAGGIGGALSTTRLYNTTVSGNSAGIWAGGLYAKIAQIYNSTIVGNSAAGSLGSNLLVSGTTANLTIRNSIVADPTGAPNCSYGGSGVITSEGGNFESPGDTCTFDDASDTTDVVVSDIGLTQLLDLGGPTRTHGLFPESLAVDTAAAGCEALDQRGETRSDGLCDAGAFEVQAAEDVHEIFGGASASFEDGTFGSWIVVGGP